MDRPDFPEPGMSGIHDLEKKLGVRFSRPELLLQALTHRSFTGENRAFSKDNERLEFLGDAVLELVISHLLYEKFGRDHDEGDLTKMRAWLVNETSLAEKARNLDIGAALRLGRGEEKSGGRDKPSILADAFEALVGALYLDRGIEKVFAFTEKVFEDTLNQVLTSGLSYDYKTALQEFTQAGYQATPEYRLEGISGPAHCRTFEVSVYFNGRPVSKGTGKSKKEAEQQAAERALKILKK